MATTILGMDATISIEGTEIASAQNVTVTLTTAEADATTRGSGGYRRTRPTIKDIEVSWEQVVDTDEDTFYTAVQAMTGGSEVTLSVSGGGILVSGEFIITNASAPAPLDGIVIGSVTAKPGWTATPTVGGGS
jgi:DNA polymerase/3'-5' exonuclease PolX